MSDEQAGKPWPHPVVHLEPRRLELIRGYRVHEKRTPSADVYRVTAAQTIGPYYPNALLQPGENDLTRRAPGAPSAEGDPFALSGTVRDEDGRPVRGALIEIWQANKWGRYEHPVDPGTLPVDPAFRGFGRCLTDEEGRYHFRTIKPGAYPNPGYDNWLRPPHIHFSLFGAGVLQRLITQMYFPGEELNHIDPILNGVADLEMRDRLIARPDGQDWTFDIVLRGRAETLFFVDD